jgi:hypothetical protein
MDNPIDDDDPWTYFGLFSNEQIAVVKQILSRKEIEFYEVKTQETEQRLKSWGAWDASSIESKEGHELFIHDHYIEKLGSALVDLFPHRSN